MKWVVYFLMINAISFIIMGIDKHRAQKSQWRIREKTLFLWAVIGGSFGIYCGMKYFRHKTKHKRFTIGIPFILLVQVGIATLINMLK
ncbi:DUF1294 domain-containing protein [bacterium LRH843]|nr:DUF1294 domain-containing protein [bacterium LRH843]